VRIGQEAFFGIFQQVRNLLTLFLLFRGLLSSVLEFTEVDSCQRQGKWIDEEQGGRIVLVVSFVLEERIDRRVFW